MSEIPEPRKIEVSAGEVLRIDWEDGATTSMTAAELRACCPCAGCRTHASDGGETRDYGAAKIESTVLVGTYALGFTFSPDQHGTGIYSFEMLRGYAVR